MTALVEFLTARLDEDEAFVINGDCRCGDDRQRPDCNDRVLREVAAKRAIIADHPKGGYPGEPAGCGCGDLWPCPTIRALSSVYSDHPDYREEWR